MGKAKYHLCTPGKYSISARHAPSAKQRPPPSRASSHRCQTFWMKTSPRGSTRKWKNGCAAGLWRRRRAFVRRSHPAEVPAIWTRHLPSGDPILLGCQQYELGIFPAAIPQLSQGLRVQQQALVSTVTDQALVRRAEHKRTQKKTKNKRNKPYRTVFHVYTDAFT